MLAIKLEELTLVAELGVDSVGDTEAVEVGASSAGGLFDLSVFLDLSVRADDKLAGVSNEGVLCIVLAVCISETGHIGWDIDY